MFDVIMRQSEELLRLADEARAARDRLRQLADQAAQLRERLAPAQPNEPQETARPLQSVQ
jgi:hypothetical protein